MAQSIPVPTELKKSAESRISAAGFLTAVLLLPLLILWRQDNVLFTGVGYIDPWCKFGFFRNLMEFKRNFYPGSSLGGHLSWLLPGAAMHALFTPVTANVLLHLGVFSVATVSLFLTLKWLVGARRAFLGALMFSVNPWLWFAAAWDYGDGGGIAYCLLTLALLTRAALNGPRGWILMAAGMSLAALIYLDVYWVVMAPVLLLYFISLSRAPVLNSFLLLCRWMLMGAVIVTIVLGIANYLLDGHFFFYAPVVLEALRFPRSEGPWYQDVVQRQASLWSAAMAAAIAVAAIISDRRRSAGSRDGVALRFAVLFFCALAWTVLLQITRVPSGFYCFSNLLPFSFLLIGAWFWQGVDSIPIRAYIWICCGVSVLLALTWLDGPGSTISNLPNLVWVTSGFFVLSLLRPRSPAGMVLSLATMLAMTGYSASRLYSGIEPHAFRSQYDSLIEARGAIEATRRGHAIRFWYDQQDAAFPDAVALTSSYVWYPSLLSQSFKKAPCEADLDPGAYVAAISANPMHGSGFAASALSGCWSRRGLQAIPVGIKTIDRGSYVYAMSLLRIEPVPGK